jgi:hypothetical protein
MAGRIEWEGDSEAALAALIAEQAGIGVLTGGKQITATHVTQNELIMVFNDDMAIRITGDFKVEYGERKKFELPA